MLGRIGSKYVQIQSHFPHRDPHSGHNQRAGSGGEDGVVPLVGCCEPSQCCTVRGEAKDVETCKTTVCRVVSYAGLWSKNEGVGER